MAEEHTPSFRDGFRELTRGHERAIGGVAATAMLSGFCEAGILAAIAQVGTALVYKGHNVHIELGPLHLNPSIGSILILAGVLSVLRIALLGWSASLQARLASDIQATLRNELFGAFTRASWGLQSREREGHLQEMMTAQILQSTMGTLQLAALVSSAITFAVLLLSALALNVLAALVVVVVSIVMFAALRPLSSYGRRSARELSRSQLDFASGVGEAVRMTEETHVFGVGEAQRARVGGLVGEAQRLAYQAQFVNRLVPTLFQSLIYLTVIGGLGALYETHAGNVASLGAVVLIMVRAGTYGQQVQTSYQTIIQALPFSERVRRETAKYTADELPRGGLPLPRIERLSFEDVSYSYRAGDPVLSEIGFDADRGEALGIVGPSGAGKSTLVQLLLGLRAPVEGTYAINGVPAEQFSPGDWHRQVAYVPQRPQLLHASVADNIRYFRDIDIKMVERAARLARIEEEILAWPQGYETIIGPRADSISGGQQQRICLARALAAAPDVLVLDEPTSALDPRSEILIQESLTEIAAELTLFVVTHRMSLLSVCDSVLVIVDGRVADFGATEVLRERSQYLSTV